MRQVGVGDPLALAVPQALQLSIGQDPGPLRLGESRQRLPDLRIAAIARRRRGRIGGPNQCAVPVGDDQELAKVPLGLGSAPNPQKVYQLDEQPGAPAARLAHGAHQLGQAGEKAIVPDPEQGPARHVPNAGGLDHQRCRPPPRESLVPCQHLRRDEPVLGGTPRHHGRHPGALRQVESSCAQRAEPARSGRLARGRRLRRRNGVFDEGFGVPHGGYLSSSPAMISC